MAKHSFMMGRYKWLVKVLSVGAECKGEDPNAEYKKPTSTKQHNTTANNGFPAKSDDEKVKSKYIQPHFYSGERKVFNDPIHGHMALHPLLVNIIDTPEFQRLRNIKQLGGIYFVYPGASHNRFEHSIGVAHLAGELAKALKIKQEEQIETIKKSEQLDDSEKSMKLDKLEKSLISDRDVLCVQIAGLCHDLGHGPYSHFYDGIFMDAIKRKKADKDGKPDKHGKTDKHGKADEDESKHEVASIKMFTRLLEKNGLEEEMEKYGLNVKGKDENDLKFIKELIKGLQKDAASNEWPYEGRKKEKSFLYEIVSNKETGIDVDKFDYFARDCYHLGIPKSFDHQRFIMFARVCDAKGQKHICPRDKELANLYDLFQTRLSIHRRACQHKIKMAVEIMIKDALLLVDDHPDFKIKNSEGKMLPLSQANGDMEAFIKLTDPVIEKILNSSYKESWFYSLFFGNENSEKLDKARKILHRVMKRDLYYCVGQARLKNGKISEDKMNDLREKLVQDIPGISKDNFEVIDVTLDYGMEDSNPIDKVFFHCKKNPEKGIPMSKLQESSLFPNRFSEKILRVYWKERDNGIIKKAKKSFKDWCTGNGFEMKEEEEGGGDDTPAAPGNEQSI